MHTPNYTAHNLIFSISLYLGFINLRFHSNKAYSVFLVDIGSPIHHLSSRSLPSRLLAVEISPSFRFRKGKYEFPPALILPVLLVFVKGNFFCWSAYSKICLVLMRLASFPLIIPLTMHQRQCCCGILLACIICTR